MNSVMSFSKVVGHEQAIEVLRRAIHTGHLPQAYLFVGPPNVGKTLVAKEFAKAVNCERLGEPASPEEVDACDECHNCVRIEEENHPDFQLLKPAVMIEVTEKPPPRSKQRPRKVEVFIELPDGLIYTGQISELITRLSAKRAAARWRVYIITSAERLTYPDAQNKLLKTLEEPPPATTFVLTTAHLSALLPTTVSRCQIIKFHPLAIGEMRRALRERFPDLQEEVLQAAAAMSGGRYGRALHVLERREALKMREELLDMAAETAGAPLVQSLRFGERLADLAKEWWEKVEEQIPEDEAAEGTKEHKEAELRGDALEKLFKASPDRIQRIVLSELLDMLQSWYRDLTLVRVAPESELVINADRREQLLELAQQYSPAAISRASEVIEEARRELRGNANLRLACEVLTLKLIAARRRR